MKMRYYEDMVKQYVLKQLQKQVMRYFQRHLEVKLIVATGSVGKSSTMRATADLLSQKYRVRMHESDDLTPELVPLAILGISEPSERAGLREWLSILKAAKARVRQLADTDIIIAELRVSHPGDMAAYATYLHPDIAFITAVAIEQQQAFGSTDALAQEYLAVSRFSRYTLINRDDVDARFANFETSAEFSTYGTSGAAEYRFEIEDQTVQRGYAGSAISVNFEPFNANIYVLGEHSLRPVVGGIAAAMRMGLSPDEIKKGLEYVKPLPGRMSPLLGFGDTTIIDDSYNANSTTVAAAIKTLYACEEDTISERIAVISDLPGMGAAAAGEYQRLGALCDPSLMNWLVTVGPETAQYLAPAARLKGCQVRTARNAVEAAEMVRAESEVRALILVSGSRSWYLEETVKLLCDENQDLMLVRQTPELEVMKQAHFEQFQRMP